ncbi:hypothetical protein M9Y10_026455 [Tritrichomonas musculus]|uniref:Protein kinase domain-containing protein n=1 Tax=Tritrichomonas musculus TaxID=1915356 RepID=A0ABR2H8Q3_9EUKA
MIDKQTLKPLCKKVLKVEGATFEDIQNAVKEFEVLHALNHPCFCVAYGINPTEVIKSEDDKEPEITTVALFLEYIDFKLKDCLSQEKINSTLKTRIVLEIVYGMRYLHEKGLIYRDLNIDNIILNSFFNAKLIDFGLVRVNELLFGKEMMNSISMTKGVGDGAYMPPEMMNDEDYDNKTDAYSYGIVLYYIFLRTLPHQTFKDKALLKSIPLPEELKSISNACIELIRVYTLIDPNSRPPFEDIINYLRKNKYMLAPDVDPTIVKARDEELESLRK